MISKRHWPKLAALLFWFTLIAFYQWYTITSGLTVVEIMRSLLGVMQAPILGPVFFIVFYIIQPLFFFPSWLLTVAGGFLFGPFWAIVYTIFASNLSSMVAYITGRYFGAGFLQSEQSQNLLQAYAERMRQHSFETVLVMRFLYLPYDIVSYLAGFLRIAWRPFLLATIIGSLPGTVSFVLLGSSIEGDFQASNVGINPRTLVLSIFLLTLSLALSYYFRHRTISS